MDCRAVQGPWIQALHAVVCLDSLSPRKQSIKTFFPTWRVKDLPPVPELDFGL